MAVISRGRRHINISAAKYRPLERALSPSGHDTIEGTNESSHSHEEQGPPVPGAAFMRRYHRREMMVTVFTADRQNLPLVPRAMRGLHSFAII